MDTVQSRIDSLVKEFLSFSTWEEKYSHIIQIGKSLDAMEDSYKTELNLVKGCQSQVWLHGDLIEAEESFEGSKDTVHFSADSDASIVKGIISILLEVYNDLTPEQILKVNNSFIDEIGLRQHLSMSRANGLNSMMKQIKLYAMAFEAKLDLKRRD